MVQKNKINLLIVDSGNILSTALVDALVHYQNIQLICRRRADIIESPEMNLSSTIASAVVFTDIVDFETLTELVVLYKSKTIFITTFQNAATLPVFEDTFDATVVYNVQYSTEQFTAAIDKALETLGLI